MQETAANVSTPKREDCKDWILHTLDNSDGKILSKELEEQAKAAGYSYATMRRAKQDLKDDNIIKFSPIGNNKDRVWQVQRVDGFSELPESVLTPWDNPTV